MSKDDIINMLASELVRCRSVFVWINREINLAECFNRSAVEAEGAIDSIDRCMGRVAAICRDMDRLSDSQTVKE